MDCAWQWANSGRFVVDPGLKSLLLLGGTFDPVHNGHTVMATAALAETGVKQLIILPAGNPYQRNRMAFATAQQRTAMLQIAFADIVGATIDTRELSRCGPTYTVDTLRELRQAHGDSVSLNWLIGGDAFAGIDSWHQWPLLFTLANFAVIIRQGAPHPLRALSATLQSQLVNRQTAAYALGNSCLGKFAILAATVPQISSTDLRIRLKTRQSIRGLAPDAVCDYIEQHKLYEQEEKS